MAIPVKKPLKLFYCYARKDKALLDELAIHLTIFKREQLITDWYDGQIIPGEEWEKEIDKQLQSAHIILLLITPDFIASDYCYGIEMQRALQRHRDGMARVIPLILRRCSWENTPFSFLQVLPTDAKPIRQWPDQDEAFWNITVGIRQTINELHTLLKTSQEWFDEGNALISLKRYEEALFAYEKVLLLDPTYVTAWNSKGDVLMSLKRYEEALKAYEQVLLWNPNEVTRHLMEQILQHLYMNEQIIYIRPDDDLTTVRDRLERVQSSQVTLVIPSKTVLHSHVAWKLLHARARELGKEVLIISSDPQIRSVAQAVKFSVSSSLESLDQINKSAASRPRPARRPGSTRP